MGILEIRGVCPGQFCHLVGVLEISIRSCQTISTIVGVLEISSTISQFPEFVSLHNLTSYTHCCDNNEDCEFNYTD